MANVTNISVLDSAATTATVSTLDAFRANIGTSYLNTSATIVSVLPSITVQNATAALLNATITGTAALSGTVLVANATASLLNATLGAGAAQIGSVTSTISGSVTVANATASLLNGTVVLAAGAAQVGSVTAAISGSVTVANATASLFLATATGTIGLGGVTSGGTLLSSTIATATNNLTVVKNSAGQVYEIVATNNTATIAYLKLYDNTTVAAGSGTPVWRIMIPGNSSGGAGLVETAAIGKAFLNGICFATTGGISDTDSSVVLGGALLINIAYK